MPKPRGSPPLLAAATPLCLPLPWPAGADAAVGADAVAGAVAGAGAGAMVMVHAESDELIAWITRRLLSVTPHGDAITVLCLAVTTDRARCHRHEDGLRARSWPENRAAVSCFLLPVLRPGPTPLESCLFWPVLPAQAQAQLEHHT